MIISFGNSQRVSHIKAVRSGIDTKGDSKRWDAGTGHTPQPRDKEVPLQNQGCSARLEVSWKATAPGVLQLLGCQQHPSSRHQLPGPRGTGHDLTFPRTEEAKNDWEKEDSCVQGEEMIPGGETSPHYYNYPSLAWGVSSLSQWQREKRN